MKKKSIKYIGGDFCELDHANFLLGSHINSQSDFYFPKQIKNKKRNYFETGSDAFAAILASLKKNSIHLWIPENFCMESLNRVSYKLKPLSLIVKKYSNLDVLKNSIGESDVILFVHFNGYQNLQIQQLNLIAKKKGAIVIEDFVQAPLDINKFQGDFAFNSFRKFLFLELSVAYLDNVGISKREMKTTYFNLKKEAGYFKELYYKNRDEVAEAKYLSLYKEAEESLNKIDEIIIAQDCEMKILNSLNLDAIKQKRIENFNYLKEKIDKVSQLTLIEGEYMYGMVKAKCRNELRNYCFNSGVFPAIHWLDAHSKESEILLSFHIDQRYDFEDMDRLNAVIKKFYLGN